MATVFAPVKKNDCCSLQNLNPRHWNAECVKKAALTVFVVSFLLLTVAVLSHHYPTASGVFLTIFSLGFVGGLIAFSVSCIKARRQVHEAPAQETFGNQATVQESAPKGPTTKEYNPFDTPKK